MTASEILVIILSVTLAVFLVLGIILTIYLIIVARKIRNVAASAERTVGQFESMASMMRKAVAPAMISKLAVDLFSRFTGVRKKKSKKGDSEDE